MVTSSLPSVVTATASASAAGGTHTLVVTQLAKRSTLVSNQLAQEGADLVDALGPGEYSFRLTVAGVDTDVTVSLEVGETNQAVLSKMAEAINGAGAAVSAAMVQDTPTTARLVLTAEDTGSAHAISVADTAGSLLSASGLRSEETAAGTSGGALYAVSELDAVVVLDGLTMSRSSNTISDALPGVTLQLWATQDSGTSPLVLTVGPNREAIQRKVQAMLDAYNKAVTFLTERIRTSVDSSASAVGTTEIHTVNRGALAGEMTYRALLMNLRADATARAAGRAAGEPASLSEIGINAAADGTLSITDEARFGQALADSVEGVAALFNDEEGFGPRLVSRLASFVAAGGILDGSLATTSARISALNEAIQLQERQLQARETVLLKQYTALQEVLAQIQRQQSVLEMLAMSSSA
jgi:flagellar hook-associated protein 2